MVQFSKIGMACAVAVLLAAPVHAVPFYATGVDWTAGDGVDLSSSRADTDNALGAPDRADDPSPIDFLSLGLSDFNGTAYSKGFADFTFGHVFGGDATGEVFEITWGSRAGYPEYARVFVGYQGVFSAVADVINSVGTGLDFNYSGTFDTVRVLDTTRFETQDRTPRSTDGFDVDAVGVTARIIPDPTLPPVPLPPAILALGTALAGLGLFSRRRKAA